MSIIPGHEVDPEDAAAELDSKAVKVLRMMTSYRDWVTTNDVKREYGWQNTVVLRRFRKLESAGLVRMEEADGVTVTYDEHLPRPPKYVDLAVEQSTARQTIIEWEGSRTKTPAQLTKDLDSIDSRVSTTKNQLTDRMDQLEDTLSDLQETTQQRAEREQTRLNRLARAAGYGVLAALVAYAVVLAAAYLFAPDLVPSVLIGGIGAAVGVALGVGIAVYVQRATTQE